MEAANLKNKLKIVQMHWGFPPTIGGVETHLTLLGPELVKRGHKVYLLTGLPEGAEHEENYEGMKVCRTPYFELNWLLQRGFEAMEGELREFLFSYLDKIKPDLIHTHNMHYFSRVHAKLLNEYARSNQVPLILTAHNVWDDGLFLDLTNEVVKWNHIIAVSNYIKEELQSVGIRESRISVVYHGVDTERFKPASAQALIKKYPQFKGKKVIFHPARMGLAKGCDTSIKAIAIVKKQVPEVMLILCGTKNIIDWNSTQQKDIAYMLHLIKTLDLEKNVYIDMIPHNLISKFYNLASVSVYPSTACEPFGITMLESLSSSVPMVVTETGGMPEIIQDGLNGYIVKVKKHNDLADRIIRLLKDTDSARRLGNNGRDMVLRSFTIEKMVDDTLDVYQQVMKGC
ncbi:MAG: glycosyltransferase family 4 protein [Candidatus Omnitrophica bacterium]|nr:glycosyltransferase family 4 protein [Candidatus Omnitrophota bacterium]